MNCRNCGKEISEDVKYCPFCGAGMREEKMEENKAQEEQADDKLTREEISQSEAAMPQREISSSDTAAAVPKKINIKLIGLFSVVVLVLVVVGAVALNVYNSPINRLKRALASENLSEAKHIYSKNHLSEEWDAQELLLEFCDKELEKFNANEKNYDSVLQILSDLQANFKLEIDAKLSTLEELKISKDRFAQAEQAEQAADLAAAVLHYESVSETDKLYETACSKADELREKYKTEIMEKAKALSDKEEFRAAVELLTESQKVLQEDGEIASLLEDNQKKADEAEVSKALGKAKESADKKEYAAAVSILNACSVTDSRITEKLTEYKALEEKQTTAAVLEKVEASVKEGDYPSAVSALKNCSVKSDEITGKLAEVTKAYEEKVLADAEALAKEGKYEEAVSVINQAIPTLGQTSSFTQKIEEYKSKYPVSLLDLEPSTGYNHAENDIYEDIYGNKYDKTLRFWGTEAITEYVNNSKYTSFSGIIFVNKAAKDTITGSVKIYCDDILIYDSVEISKKMNPALFDIDITNAKFVKIVVKQNQGFFDSGCVHIANPVFYN